MVTVVIVFTICWLPFNVLTVGWQSGVNACIVAATPYTRTLTIGLDNVRYTHFAFKCYLLNGQKPRINLWNQSQQNTVFCTVHKVNILFVSAAKPRYLVPAERRRRRRVVAAAVRLVRMPLAGHVPQLLQSGHLLLHERALSHWFSVSVVQGGVLPGLLVLHLPAHRRTGPTGCNAG